MAPLASRKDRVAAAAGAVAAAVMIAQQVGGKATRDALFLSSFPASELPKVMIASAALSLVGVLVASRLLGQLGPVRMVPAAFGSSSVLFAAEWLLVDRMPGVTAWIVYLHIGTFGAIVVSGFWSVINERFDPHTAKPFVSRIAGAATLGGLLGGLGAERVAALLDVRSMLLILAGLNVMCAIAVSRIGSPLPERVSHVDGPTASGLRLLRQVPYLQRLAALVALVAMTASLVDYGLKAQVASRFESAETLMQFFAMFYTVTGLLAFLVQSLLARRALSRLGIGGTIALLPAAVLISGVMGAAIARLWAMTLARGFDMVLRNSLFRSGYELLYTPVSRTRKRRTKPIIDVAFERCGDALGSAGVLLALSVLPGSAERIAVGAGALTAAVALWLARKLHRGYVSALVESLRSGAVKLEAAEIVDATTRRTLDEASVALERDALVREVDPLLRRRSSPSEAVGRSAEPPPPPPPRPALSEEALVDAVAVFAAGDGDGIAALLDEHLDPRLVAHVIPLLDDRRLHARAGRALRAVAPRVVGQLVDALVDPAQPDAIRCRLARALGDCDLHRAAEGLQEGLGDWSFAVRRACALALSSMVGRRPDLARSPAIIFAAIESELEDPSAWVVAREGPDGGAHWLDAATRARLGPGPAHVFTLLGLAVDRDTLRLCVRALHAGDTALRGTALEYLENVVPGPARTRLWPHLGQSPAESTGRRSHEEIVDELLGSLDSLRGHDDRSHGEDGDT